MSGIVLALLIFVTVFVSHLVFSRLFPIVKKERALVRFMGAAGVGYVAAFPFSMGFIQTITGPAVIPPMMDFATGLAALGFLVLGYAEFWSLIERSFSLRILIDIASFPVGLVHTELVHAYSGGHGLGWMMEKRIADLVGSGMLVSEGRHHRLSTRGRAIARVFHVIQFVFRIT